MHSSGSEDQVDFGFEDVSPAEKTRRVRAVFERVAERYDLMNDLMSGGVHRLWKAQLVDLITPRPGLTLLDVAGGTGDIATGVLARLAGCNFHGTAVLCDLSEAMLNAGRARAGGSGTTAGGSRLYVAGNAEALPIADGSVDVVTIAFGLRNVTDKPAALREFHRVLRPGGRFFCLEFSHVSTPGLARLYDWYSFTILPQIGRLVAGDRDAYQYLVESIRRFPDRAALSAMIEDAGMDRVRVRSLSGGIAAIHAAWRL